MNKRNPTAKGLALRGAIILSITTGLCAFLIIQLESLPLSWLHLFGLCAAVGIVAYLVIYAFIDRFIYRKIKLIYKTIHAQKIGKGDDKLIPQRNSLDTVNEEVDSWLASNNAEIARLTELEAYRKEFLGNVFHEIKTPVFSVQGYLHTLENGAIDDPNVSKSFLKKARKNIDRLDEIVGNLELIALQENNKLILERTNFDITALVREVIEALEIQAREFGAKLTIKPGCDIPFHVNADKERIRQVLVNLVSNAIKYGKENGVVEMGIYEMGEQILTEVTDQGKGLPEDELPRLFERFYRTDKSRFRGNTGGSGLGLAIVKHIIETHEQQVTVRSKIDIGSTFGFTLAKAIG